MSWARGFSIRPEIGNRIWAYGHLDFPDLMTFVPLKLAIYVVTSSDVTKQPICAIGEYSNTAKPATVVGRGVEHWFTPVAAHPATLMVRHDDTSIVLFAYEIRMTEIHRYMHYI